jgi:hypothetical protein
VTDTTQRLAFLKRIHLFRGLNDEQLISVTEAMEDVKVKSGETIFQQGDPADAFYLIYRGQVRISHKLPDKREESLGRLVAGDYFGEEGVITGHKRSAAVTTETETFLLRLEITTVRRLLRQIPSLNANFDIMMSGRQLARQLHFKWLGVNEVVYFLARKHPVLLVQSLVAPVIGLVIPFGLLATNLFVKSDIPWLLALLSLVGLIFWAVWKVIDWGNDYYIVTNQRVIWLERVIGIYDSRQEAPLHTILSVGVETDYWSRQFDFGTVNVRTFVGSIRLTHVSHPKQAAAMIEEYWARTKETARQSEHETMQAAIRGKLGISPPKPAAPQKPSTLPTIKREYQPSMLQILFANFLKLRFEESDIITYRKHWFVLIRNTFKQFAIFIVLLFSISGWPYIFGGFMSTWLLTLTGAMIFIDIGWWIYDYVDWANDIYQVSHEQIVDINRKPLGKENRKAAPLENILSTEYERNGVLGLLLNFGTVNIMVGGTRFDFEDVFDPPQVQQDVIRRMSARIAKKKESESTAERERLAEWFAAYYKLNEQLHEPENRKPPNPE